MHCPNARTEAPLVEHPTWWNTADGERPTRDEIARRAFQTFLARGGQPGHDVEDWLAAEVELCHHYT